MTGNVHWKLISRLLAVWLVLSILFGIVVFYLETEQIDRTVVNLAYNQSHEFMESHAFHLASGDPGELQRFKHESELLLNNNFVYIEIYDLNKNKIVETSKQDLDFSAEMLNQNLHQFPSYEQSTYRKFYHDNTLYLQVIVPVHDKQGSVYAYYEGIYQVDQQTTNNIQNHVIWSLAQTVIVIFITTLVLYPIILVLNRQMHRYSKQLLHTNIELLDVLGRVTEKRDHETNLHNYRVTIYSVSLAEAIGLADDSIKTLIKGGFLHDIGKIAISDDILLKPGKLTPEQFEIMKTHVDHGVDIIKHSEWLQDAIPVVKYHHEKFDGSGYAMGLKGADIPITAQIFAVADVFDALTSMRPYKEAFTLHQAVTILNEGKGIHFDPYLVEAFLQIADSLYDDLTQKDDAYIHSALASIIQKYY